MAKFDVPKTNVAIERLLAVTENPRHRFLLQAYITVAPRRYAQIGQHDRKRRVLFKGGQALLRRAGRLTVKDLLGLCRPAGLQRFENTRREP
jgi:hypothetical protein